MIEVGDLVRFSRKYRNQFRMFGGRETTRQNRRRIFRVLAVTTPMHEFVRSHGRLERNGRLITLDWMDSFFGSGRHKVINEHWLRVVKKNRVPQSA